MAYGFREQLELGKAGESRLNGLWRDLRVVDVSDDPEWRRAGVDRLLVFPDGRQVTVEYKTDFIAHRTGNLVFETVSDDVTGVPGWGLSSKAEYLVYLVEKAGVVYLIRLPELREWVLARVSMFRRAAADNGTYRTLSLLVPFSMLEGEPFVRKLRVRSA